MILLQIGKLIETEQNFKKSAKVAAACFVLYGAITLNFVS